MSRRIAQNVKLNSFVRSRDHLAATCGEGNSFKNNGGGENLVANIATLARKIKPVIP